MLVGYIFKSDRKTKPKKCCNFRITNVNVVITVKLRDILVNRHI